MKLIIFIWKVRIEHQFYESKLTDDGERVSRELPIW